MFATVNQVKIIDGSIRVADNDVSLSAIVDGVNAKVADYLDRHLLIDDYTDIFNVYPTRTATYKLKGYPVVSVASVMLDNEELSVDLYRVNNRMGTVELLVPAPYGVSQVTIEYTGGMAVDETALRALYPAIVYETCLQALFEFKRNQKIAHSEIAIKEGGSETLIKRGLTAEFKRAVRKYRRFTGIA